jgi:hypothetical protein
MEKEAMMQRKAKILETNLGFIYAKAVLGL